MFLGFPPVRSSDRKSWFERLATVGGVVVFYEAPHRIERTLEELVGLIGDRPGFVAREVTKVHEELVIGPISTLLAKLSADKGEFTVVVDVGKSVPESGEFGLSTEKHLATRRQLVTDLAEKVGVQANELYKAIETLKNMGHKTN
jgi:16S rRNA (cytidine1402-2'-O)-methyltransferase